MQSEIDEVLQRLNTLIQADGSSLALIEAKGDSIKLRFTKAENAQCESCVIDDDTMHMLVREAVTNHLPYIRSIDFV